MNYKDYFYSTFDDDTRLIEAGLKPYIYEYYDDFDDLGYGFDSIDGLCGDSSSGKNLFNILLVVLKKMVVLE